jgi:hypothetical protein
LKNEKKLIFGILSIVAISGLLVARYINMYPSNKLCDVTFNEDRSVIHQFYYSDTLQNEYLRKLRTDFKLNELTQQASSDIEKVKIILNWANSQWEHSGKNKPEKSDAISILNEAKQGKKFRRVEYGIVCAAAFNSLGYKSRVIRLKTKDVETVLLAPVMLHPKFLFLNIINGYLPMVSLMQSHFLMTYCSMPLNLRKQFNTIIIH